MKYRIIGDVIAPVRFLTPSPYHILSAVELRTFIQFFTKILLSFCCSFRRNLPCSHSPLTRLNRVPSSVIRGGLSRLGRGLPMSLNPSPLILNNTIGKVRGSFL
jgi:hypothetical protein